MSLLQEDEVFGTLYLSVEDFASRATMFGLSSSVLPDEDDIIQAYLAAASRLIESKTNKTFVPDDHVEQHNWNAETRRITVNNPPILSVSDYRIYTGTTTYATMPTNALFINNQENWVEVTALTAAGNLTSMLLTVGLFHPIVQITYKSSQEVKQNIMLATGYIAAALINQSFIDQGIQPGLKSIKIGSQAQLVRSDSNTKIYGVALPSIIDLLLASDVAIGIA